MAANSEKGFTLMELQVAVVVMLMALAGLSVSVMNYLKQVQLVEKKRALFTFINTKRDKIVFANVLASGDKSLINYVNVDSLTDDGSTVDVETTLVKR